MCAVVLQPFLTVQLSPSQFQPPPACNPLLCCSYDASAHLSEETRNAAVTASKGIVMTVVVSFLVGWAYLFSLVFSIQVR